MFPAISLEPVKNPNALNSVFIIDKNDKKRKKYHFQVQLNLRNWRVFCTIVSLKLEAFFLVIVVVDSNL